MYSNSVSETMLHILHIYVLGLQQHQQHLTSYGHSSYIWVPIPDAPRVVDQAQTGTLWERLTFRKPAG